MVCLKGKKTSISHQVIFGVSAPNFRIYYYILGPLMQPSLVPLIWAMHLLIRALTTPKRAHLFSGLRSCMRHIRTQDPVQPWPVPLSGDWLIVLNMKPLRLPVLRHFSMKRRGNLCCEVRKLLSGVRRYTEMCVSVAVRDTPTVNPLTQDVTMCETVRWSPIKPEQSAFPCNKRRYQFVFHLSN